MHLCWQIEGTSCDAMCQNLTASKPFFLSVELSKCMASEYDFGLFCLITCIYTCVTIVHTYTAKNVHSYIIENNTCTYNMY